MATSREPVSIIKPVSHPAFFTRFLLFKAEPLLIYFLFVEQDVFGWIRVGADLCAHGNGDTHAVSLNVK